MIFEIGACCSSFFHPCHHKPANCRSMCQIFYYLSNIIHSHCRTSGDAASHASRDSHVCLAVLPWTSRPCCMRSRARGRFWDQDPEWRHHPTWDLPLSLAPGEKHDLHDNCINAKKAGGGGGGGIRPLDVLRDKSATHEDLTSHCAVAATACTVMKPPLFVNACQPKIC